MAYKATIIFVDFKILASQDARNTIHLAFLRQYFMKSSNTMDLLELA